MSGFKEAGDYLNLQKFKRRPRYSIVFHNVREKLDLSINTYVVIDSIHKLSTNDPRFPYCVMSKDKLASFLKISRRTVFRSIDEAEQKGLIERCEHGLRTTELWIKETELYSIEAA